LDDEDVSINKERESTLFLNEGNKLIVFGSGGTLNGVKGMEALNLNGSFYAMLK